MCALEARAVVSCSRNYLTLMTGGAFLVLLTLSVYKQNSEALVQQRDGPEPDKVGDGARERVSQAWSAKKKPKGETSIFTQNVWWQTISPPDCSCYADKTKNTWVCTSLSTVVHHLLYHDQLIITARHRMQEPVDNRCFTPTYQGKTYYCNEVCAAEQRLSFAVFA